MHKGSNITFLDLRLRCLEKVQTIFSQMVVNDDGESHGTNFKRKNKITKQIQVK